MAIIAMENRMLKFFLIAANIFWTGSPGKMIAAILPNKGGNSDLIIIKPLK